MGDEEIVEMICAPVAIGDDVIPGSITAKCSECGVAVWLSPSGQEVTATLFCPPCGMERMSKRMEEGLGVQIESLSQEQARELLDQGGEELLRFAEQTIRRFQVDPVFDEDPGERTAALGTAALDAIKEHPAFHNGVKAIIFVHDDDAASTVTGGYGSIESPEMFNDLMHFLAAHAKEAGWPIQMVAVPQGEPLPGATPEQN